MLTSLSALTDNSLLLCLGIVRDVVPRVYEFWILYAGWFAVFHQSLCTSQALHPAIIVWFSGVSTHDCGAGSGTRTHESLTDIRLTRKPMISRLTPFRVDDLPSFGTRPRSLSITFQFYSLDVPIILDKENSQRFS